MAFVIPQRILHLAEVARYLTSQYDRLTILRFPDGEYECFKQVLLLAIRRDKYNVPSNEEIAGIDIRKLKSPLKLDSGNIHTV